MQKPDPIFFIKSARLAALDLIKPRTTWRPEPTWPLTKSAILDAYIIPVPRPSKSKKSSVAVKPVAANYAVLPIEATQAMLKVASGFHISNDQFIKLWARIVRLEKH